MSSIEVAIRVRPSTDWERSISADVVTVDNNTVCVNEGDEEEKGVMRRIRAREYIFDHCFGPNSTQEEVFQSLSPLLLTAFTSNRNGSMIAYGQTGSGKTFTMLGDMVYPGLIPRICEACINLELEMNGLEVSFYEIYNDKVRDLLSSILSSSSIPKLRVREHPVLGPYIQGLSWHDLYSQLDLCDILTIGCVARSSGATTFHSSSSRSHAIFTVRKKGSSVRMNFVDLAGSERHHVRGTKNQIRETAYINKSLATLGSVILALSSKKARRAYMHIPYRDSTITWLLKDSIGGQSKTIMIGTVAPSSKYRSETLNTLRYAHKARNIVNRLSVIEKGLPFQDPYFHSGDTNRVIQELREEVARLKAMINANPPSHPLVWTQSQSDNMYTNNNEHHEVEPHCSSRHTISRGVMTSPIQSSTDGSSIDLEEALRSPAQSVCYCRGDSFIQMRAESLDKLGQRRSRDRSRRLSDLEMNTLNGELVDVQLDYCAKYLVNDIIDQVAMEYDQNTLVNGSNGQIMGTGISGGHDQPMGSGISGRLNDLVTGDGNGSNDRSVGSGIITENGGRAGHEINNRNQMSDGLEIAGGNNVHATAEERFLDLALVPQNEDWSKVQRPDDIILDDEVFESEDSARRVPEKPKLISDHSVDRILSGSESEDFSTLPPPPPPQQVSLFPSSNHEQTEERISANNPAPSISSTAAAKYVSSIEQKDHQLGATLSLDQHVSAKPRSLSSLSYEAEIEELEPLEEAVEEQLDTDDNLQYIKYGRVGTSANEPGSDSEPGVPGREDISEPHKNILQHTLKLDLSDEDRSESYPDDQKGDKSLTEGVQERVRSAKKVVRARAELRILGRERRSSESSIDLDDSEDQVDRRENWKRSSDMGHSKMVPSVVVGSSIDQGGGGAPCVNQGEGIIPCVNQGEGITACVNREEITACVNHNEGNIPCDIKEEGQEWKLQLPVDEDHDSDWPSYNGDSFESDNEDKKEEGSQHDQKLLQSNVFKPSELSLLKGTENMKGTMDREGMDMDRKELVGGMEEEEEEEQGQNSNVKITHPPSTLNVDNGSGESLISELSPPTNIFSPSLSDDEKMMNQNRLIFPINVIGESRLPTISLINDGLQEDMRREELGGMDSRAVDDVKNGDEEMAGPLGPFRVDIEETNILSDERNRADWSFLPKEKEANEKEENVLKVIKDGLCELIHSHQSSLEDNRDDDHLEKVVLSPGMEEPTKNLVLTGNGLSENLELTGNGLFQSNHDESDEDEIEEVLEEFEEEENETSAPQVTVLITKPSEEERFPQNTMDYLELPEDMQEVKREIIPEDEELDQWVPGFHGSGRRFQFAGGDQSSDLFGTTRTGARPGSGHGEADQFIDQAEDKFQGEAESSQRLEWANHIDHNRSLADHSGNNRSWSSHIDNGQSEADHAYGSQSEADHTDHDRVEADHADHDRSEADHTDHDQSEADHTDHGQSEADHSQLQADHSDHDRLEADHNLSIADHIDHSDSKNHPEADKKETHDGSGNRSFTEPTDHDEFHASFNGDGKTDEMNHPHTSRNLCPDHEDPGSSEKPPRSSLSNEDSPVSNPEVHVGNTSNFERGYQSDEESDIGTIDSTEASPNLPSGRLSIQPEDLEEHSEPTSPFSRFVRMLEEPDTNDYLYSIQEEEDGHPQQLEAMWSRHPMIPLVLEHNDHVMIDADHVMGDADHVMVDADHVMLTDHVMRDTGHVMTHAGHVMPISGGSSYHMDQMISSDKTKKSNIHIGPFEDLESSSQGSMSDFIEQETHRGPSMRGRYIYPGQASSEGTGLVSLSNDEKPSGGLSSDTSEASVIKVDVPQRLHSPMSEAGSESASSYAGRASRMVENSPSKEAAIVVWKEYEEHHSSLDETKEKLSIGTGLGITFSDVHETILSFDPEAGNEVTERVTNVVLAPNHYVRPVIGRMYGNLEKDDDDDDEGDYGHYEQQGQVITPSVRQDTAEGDSDYPGTSVDSERVPNPCTDHPHPQVQAQIQQAPLCFGGTIIGMDRRGVRDSEKPGTSSSLEEGSGRNGNEHQNRRNLPSIFGQLEDLLEVTVVDGVPHVSMTTKRESDQKRLKEEEEKNNEEKKQDEDEDEEVEEKTEKEEEEKKTGEKSGIVGWTREYKAQLKEPSSEVENDGQEVRDKKGMTEEFPVERAGQSRINGKSLEVTDWSPEITDQDSKMNDLASKLTDQAPKLTDPASKVTNWPSKMMDQPPKVTDQSSDHSWNSDSEPTDTGKHEANHRLITRPSGSRDVPVENDEVFEENGHVNQAMEDDEEIEAAFTGSMNILGSTEPGLKGRSTSTQSSHNTIQRPFHHLDYGSPHGSLDDENDSDHSYHRQRHPRKQYQSPTAGQSEDADAVQNQGPKTDALLSQRTKTKTARVSQRPKAQAEERRLKYIQGQDSEVDENNTCAGDEISIDELLLEEINRQSAEQEMDEPKLDSSGFSYYDVEDENDLRAYTIHLSDDEETWGHGDSRIQKDVLRDVEDVWRNGDSDSNEWDVDGEIAKSSEDAHATKDADPTESQTRKSVRWRDIGNGAPLELGPTRKVNSTPSLKPIIKTKTSPRQDEPGNNGHLNGTIFDQTSGPSGALRQLWDATSTEAWTPRSAPANGSVQGFGPLGTFGSLGSSELVGSAVAPGQEWTPQSSLAVATPTFLGLPTQAPGSQHAQDPTRPPRPPRPTVLGTFHRDSMDVAKRHAYVGSPMDVTDASVQTDFTASGVMLSPFPDEPLGATTSGSSPLSAMSPASQLNATASRASPTPMESIERFQHYNNYVLLSDLLTLVHERDTVGEALDVFLSSSSSPTLRHYTSHSSQRYIHGYATSLRMTKEELDERIEMLIGQLRHMYFDGLLPENLGWLFSRRCNELTFKTPRDDVQLRPVASFSTYTHCTLHHYHGCTSPPCPKLHISPLDYRQKLIDLRKALVMTCNDMASIYADSMFNKTFYNSGNENGRASNVGSDEGIAYDVGHRMDDGYNGNESVQVQKQHSSPSSSHTVNNGVVGMKLLNEIRDLRRTSRDAINSGKDALKLSFVSSRSTDSPGWQTGISRQRNGRTSLKTVSSSMEDTKVDAEIASLLRLYRQKLLGLQNAHDLEH